ncbi:hypothetical protein [Ferruginibacter sp.]
MYEKFTDDELIEAYQSMMEYSGQPNDEMRKAIEQRGGMEIFIQNIAHKKTITAEINRISKEIYQLVSPETNAGFIRQFIKSDILSKEALDDLVEQKTHYYQSILENKKVDSKTFMHTAFAAIAACIAGAIIVCLLLHFITPVFLYFVVPVYIINYLIIWAITKKTRANIVIFIATLLATIFSFISGGVLAGLFFG